MAPATRARLLVLGLAHDVGHAELCHCGSEVIHRREAAGEARMDSGQAMRLR
jgi:hypothetical protein